MYYHLRAAERAVAEGLVSPAPTLEPAGSFGEDGTCLLFTPLMSYTVQGSRNHTKPALEQMLSALDHLACSNMCHRDVKPENMLY
jgi:hypothetical protein